MAGLTDVQLAQVKVLIVDTTSATTEQHSLWLERFSQQENMQVILFASSDFKNKQMGADKNPYGTIRVFAKNAAVRDAVITYLRQTEIPITSVLSHHYRRLMKELGATTQNAAILNYQKATAPGVTSSYAGTAQSLAKSMAAMLRQDMQPGEEKMSARSIEDHPQPAAQYRCFP